MIHGLQCVENFGLIVGRGHAKVSLRSKTRLLILTYIARNLCMCIYMQDVPHECANQSGFHCSAA